MQLPKIIKLLFFSSVFAAAYMQASAEDILLPEDEAAPVLYSGTLGDADVDLFMFGSWNLHASYGTVLPIPGILPATPYRLTPGPYFQQIPDLTVSLWLMNRYFIETSFLPGAGEQNTYVMGILGGEDDFLKTARIGNKGISMPQNQLITIPEGSTGGFGGYAHFGTDRWDNHVLVRFDSFTRESLEYKGTSAVQSTSIPLEAYMRGVSFLLPDVTVQNTAVFVQDVTGSLTGDDGIRYAEMDPVLYTIDKETGYIEFNQPLTRKTLITYATGAGAVGVDGSGISGLCGTSDESLDAAASPADFSWNSDYMGAALSRYRVFLNGGGGSYAALVLWNNGAFSPFENAVLYSANVQTTEGFIVGTLVPPDETEGDIPVTLQVQDGRIAVVPPDGTARANSRYPFTDYIADYYSGKIGSYSGWRLHITQLLPQQSIPAPADAIPGSVSVFVNGIETPQYSIENGSIKFPFPVSSGDSVRVMYSREGGESNTLMQTSYHRYDVSDSLYFHGATAYMWTIADASASSYYGQYPGVFLGTVGVEYSGELIDASLEYSGAISTEDSTGALELSGLSKNIYTLSPVSRLLVPAVSSASMLDPDNRVFGMYKDYRVQSESGLTFYQDAAWAIPSENISDGNPGSQIGPYIVKGNSLGYSTLFAAAEADLGQYEWTGLTLKLDPSDTVPDSITFAAGYQGEGEVNLIFRIGAIEEDIDGDRVLDEEQTESGSGISVQSGADNYRFGGGLITQGNGYIDTEDLNGDGYLSGEDISMIIESDMGTISQENGIVRMNVSFTDSQKAKLKELRGLEFIMQPRDIGGARGRLFIGDVEIQEQGVRTHGESGILHFDDEDERVTYEWTGEAADHGITIPFTPFPKDGYGAISLDYSLPFSSGSAADVQLVLKTGESTGYSANITLNSDSAFHPIAIDLDAMSVTVNNNTASLQPLPGGTGGSTANYRALVISFPSSSSGKLILSKPVATDPGESVNHGARLQATLRMPQWTNWMDGRLESTITAASGNVADALLPDLGYKHLRVDEKEYLSLPGTEISLYQRAEINEYASVYGFGHDFAYSPFPGIGVKEFFHFTPYDETSVLETGNGVSFGRKHIRMGLSSAGTHTKTDYTNNWNGSFEIPFSESIRATLAENIAFKVNEVPDTEDYGSGWLFSKNRLYENESGSGYYRSSESDFTFQWNFTERGELATGIQFNTTCDYNPNPVSSNEVSWNLRLRFPAGSGTVDAGFDHTGTAEYPWNREGDIFNDMNGLFSSIPSNKRLFFPFPGYHLYPYAFDGYSFDGKAVSTGGATLGYSHSSNSALLNLFIPYRTEYGVERSRTQDGTAVSDAYVHTGTIKWDTKNLFGRLSRYPMWKFYDTESITSLMSLSLAGDLDEFTYKQETNLMLYQRGDPVWEAKHNLLWSQTEFRDDSSILFTWLKTVPEFKLLYDFLTSDTLKNSEEIGFSYGNKTDESLFNSYFRHSSDLLFDPWGIIGAYMELSWIHKTQEASSTAGIGIELGIKGELTF